MSTSIEVFTSNGIFKSNQTPTSKCLHHILHQIECLHRIDRCMNIQIDRCMNIQIDRCMNIQIDKCMNIQGDRCTNIQMSQSTSTPASNAHI